MNRCIGIDQDREWSQGKKYKVVKIVSLTALYQAQLLRFNYISHFMKW
jgi:hypothetical protein